MGLVIMTPLLQLIERINKMIIDLVVYKNNEKYCATGGPIEAIFNGVGNSSNEAIGAWFTANREAVNFFVSFIENNKFSCSTQYGVGRSRNELGPNELKALEEFEKNKQNEI